MIIPDGCHIAAILVWIVAEPFLFTGWKEVISHLLAMVVYGGGLLAVSLIMDKVLGRDTMGGGDIKLFGVVGLYLGMIGTLFCMVFACLFGLVFNRLIPGDEEDERAFPFGPWIAASAAFMLLFGAPLIRWYQGLLG